MSKIYPLLLCFISILIFGQNKIVHVEYQVIYNTERPTAKEASLYFDAEQNISLFREQSSKKEGVSKSSEDGMTSIGVSIGSKSDRINYLNYKKDSLYTVQTFVKTSFLISERIPKIKWVLVDEQKKIDNYNVQKATCYFRGRNYIAWYSLEYPYQYGPWKFNGLPGLIFEISDETKRFNWQIKSINTETNTNLLNFDKTDLKEITIQEYLETEKKEYELFLENMASKMPRGVQRVKREAPPRNNLELKFEWEE